MNSAGAPILVVDDEKDIRMLLRRLLEFHSFSVVEANDGLEALALARETHPQLVLLDLNMPRLDGWQTARRMRADPQLAHIPIIGVSASATARSRVLDAGCDDYILKPLEIDDVLNRILAHLPPGASAEFSTLN